MLRHIIVVVCFSFFSFANISPNSLTFTITTLLQIKETAQGEER